MIKTSYSNLDFTIFFFQCSFRQMVLVVVSCLVLFLFSFFFSFFPFCASHHNWCICKTMCEILCCGTQKHTFCQWLETNQIRWIRNQIIDVQVNFKIRSTMLQKLLRPTFIILCIWIAYKNSIHWFTQF